jgi:hypothetical protein
MEATTLSEQQPGLPGSSCLTRPTTQPRLRERHVSYRDDREALRAEKDALQNELSAAREEIERLKAGPESTPPTPPPPAPHARTNAWLGGPARVKLVRELDTTIDEALLEELVAELRARFENAGRIERLGRTITWTSISDSRSGRALAVHFTEKNGRTQLRIEESLTRVAGALFGGIVGGAGGSGAINFVIWAIFSANVLYAIGALGWLALVYFIVRAAYTSWSKKRVHELEALAADIEERVNATAERKKRKKARVAEKAESEEAEAEAAEAEEATAEAEELAAAEEAQADAAARARPRSR